MVNEPNAQPVSRSEAVTAAFNTLRYEIVSDLSNLATDTVLVKTTNSNTLLYEVRFNNGTIVLLSGNKSCQPVLGYISLEDDGQTAGILDHYDELPDGLRFFLDMYVEQLKYCYQNRMNRASYQAQWESLLAYNGNRSYQERRVPPLIEPKWGQVSSNDGYSHAYNYYVNEWIYPTCSDCPVGCVAVAMAQILRYWNEPKDIPNKCAQYDWDNMPNELIKRNNNLYEVQRNAIAKLLIDCGHSVNMIYCDNNMCQSGAPADSIVPALRKYGYNHAVLLQMRDFSLETWESMLQSSLENSIPLQYQGENFGQSSAHSFICDGYKRTISGDYKYHFNWGWNGYCDGWFALGSLIPDGYSLSFNQYAVFNIYPSDCWQNIIMECDKIHGYGSRAKYNAIHSTKNANHQFLVGNRAYVRCFAGDEIVLSDGFHATQGSNFLAQISPCESEERSLSASSIDSGIESTEYYSGDVFIDKPSMVNRVQNRDMVIFPNPAQNQIHIQLQNSGETIVQIDIYDMVGAKYGATVRNSSTLDISNFANGTYVVKILTGSGQILSGKFIKE